MRTYYEINLNDQSVEGRTREGEDVIRVGRHFIAKTLLERGAATVDPLSADNPLIFSAGPFAGSNYSNANRISIGCKSPLTGGIKEANAGGTFGFALGQLEISGFTLNGVSDDWVIIRIPKEGDITFEDATPFMGKGNIDTAAQLFEHYGPKIAIAMISPVGEYQGLISGISFTDPEGRPVRIAARGGVGAVMGSKKVKAIVADVNKMPTFHDRRKFMGTVKEYGKMLKASPQVETFAKFGTAIVADLTNQLGGLPTRNFSSGRLIETSEQGNVMELGGTHIYERNVERGGEPTHACMPGCMIQCSNVYVDKNGEEMVSPLEYETLGLLGSNCGLTDPDDVAFLNHIANDLGIDTIEVGAMLGVLMEAGECEFGDKEFMAQALADIRDGNERGKLLSQGTYRVGKHYNVARIPTIKRQGISAYDPRTIEVTGISMMVTAMGADHTAGNIPAHKSADMSTEELCQASLEIQTECAAADSLGLCLFGRSVTNENKDFIADSLNNAHGTELEPDFMDVLGREALAMEWEFNKQAGFTEEDDELPEFFYTEELYPTNKTARHHAGPVNAEISKLMESGSGDAKDHGGY